MNALPELRAAEASLRELAARNGLVYAIADFGGVRSQADTTLAMKYRDNDYAVYLAQFRAKYGSTRAALDKYTWRPINVFGSSYHNFGAAFDALMVKGSLAQLGALAPSVGLKWGGNFIGRKDYPHFQLAISLNEAKARWLAAGNAPGVAANAALPGLSGPVALVVLGALGVAGAVFGRGFRLW